ncbi:MAG: hypothetical protein HY520_05160 [Candidatus Aenigmarchaeota archaeon]|nr:hypothetical protein [Candidatus Aenigmarchaeota archaeon]
MQRAVVLAVLAVAAAALILIPFRPTGFATARDARSYTTPLFIVETVRYPAFATVEAPAGGTVPLGLNTDPGSLGFGLLPAGESEGTRSLNVDNTKAATIKVKLEASGPIASRLTFDQRAFILPPGVKMTVAVTFHAAGASPANFSGEVAVVTLEPRNPLAEAILPWM